MKLKLMIVTLAGLAFLGSPLAAQDLVPPPDACLSPSAAPGDASDEWLLDGSGVTWASGSCTVTRFCADPPPTSVSCTSPAGNCTLGPTYVICDGVRYDCTVCDDHPDCDDDIHGTSCSSGSIPCQRNVNGECRTYLCTCFSGKWRCAP